MNEEVPSQEAVIARARAPAPSLILRENTAAQPPAGGTILP